MRGGTRGKLNSHRESPADLVEVAFEHPDRFLVHLDTRDLVFHRRNKIYVGDMRGWETYPQKQDAAAMVTTISQNESSLTKRELRGVEAARELIRTAGYPTPKEAIHLGRMEM